MKINRINIPAVNPYRTNELKVGKSAQHSAQQQDKIEISSKAKQLSEMNSYGAERKDHVQKIKEQIEAGTYKVNAEEVAKSLIDYYKK
ncbi:flagellar biosynthesis anti-sigma factor FlgM [Sporosarcina pasteurii]|uniref:Negative regulator of flagellin synthesis n=1 Tax=Sporosarcina pasteurii TaxID=1474 RepID=A0A380BDX2_SPOPA|nr:flagellar biosynthesis anti-sigma factor FlgM [Sporosarcina pasteurii]MDS9470323.1 flagellar biosynthesis anti-sigma factor FlgM [Sporosarcina pasteurii]SUI99808.1 flagellar biosynthesis anti-sigma factor FlgM [Sporosarcina pasteurii]